RGFGCKRPGGAIEHGDYRRLPADQIGRQFRHSILPPFGPAEFNRHVVAFDVSGSLKPLRNASRRLTLFSAELPPINPITGIAARRARPASAHATTAPPSAASNSRRPMVTVIRPSRARCVNGTIPPQERAVFTFKGGTMLEFARRHC